MLHHIQKEILDELATADQKRYSEINPGKLDGNVFGYHLKALISDGYVLKNDDGTYSLTAKGRDYIVHRYEDLALSAHSILLIVIKNGDNYLLRRRAIQPMIGYAGFIHGEPLHNMSIIEAASERLKDKTGLECKLSIRGSALLSQYNGTELQSFSHAVILYGETNNTDIKNSDATGKNFWSKLDDAEMLIPSCYDIITMIESGDTWLEKRYDIA